MPANVESMFSVKSVPWHKKGIVLQNPPSSEMAIKLAGLDWTVSLERLFYTVEGTEAKREVLNRRAVLRSDNRKILGTVSNRYHLLQNSEAFTFFDPFIQEGLAEYETAGSLGDGQKIWILAKFGSPISIGKDDEVRPYLLLANSHDGSLNVVVQPTTIRVVCQNTLMQSLGTGNCVRVKHTGFMKSNLKMVREQIERLLESRKQTFEAYELMATTMIDTQDVGDFLLSLWERPEMYMDAEKKKASIAFRIWEAKIAAMRFLLEFGQGVDKKPWLKGTVWWLYNAATELVDHYMGQSKNVKDRTSYIIDGDGGKLKDLAWAKAVELVNKVRDTEAISPEKVGISPRKLR